MKRIVILGAGFGGTAVARHLHRREPSAEIVMVNETNHFLFTPLLHEVATGGVSPENVVEPIRSVLGGCLTDFHLANVERVSLQKKIVTTSFGEVPYDILVLAMGSETETYGIPGVAEHAWMLKSISDAIHLKHRFIDLFEIASDTESVQERKELLHFVVAGGGPTGVELAAEMAEFFFDTLSPFYRSDSLRDDVRITLVQRAGELLPPFDVRSRKKALEILTKKGVDVRLGEGITSVDETTVMLEKSGSLAARTVIWTAGIKPRTIPFDVEVTKHTSGRLLVCGTLQLRDHENVFALGDLAALLSSDGKTLIPALAQAAEKQGKHVAQNISRLMQKKGLIPFTYKHSGSLVSIGQWMAIAEFGRFIFLGHATWWLWRTIYLTKIISFRKRIKVAVDWTFQLFSSRDISRY